MTKKTIYLDHAATTAVDKKVLQEMMPYFSDKYGNASSLHYFGQEASQAVEKARIQVAKYFNANLNEIIFTSGATESNNLVIKGVVKAYYKKEKKKPHIITTAFEHHCVLNAVKNLEKENLVEATFINPKKDGVISVADIKNAIKSNTILISVMYVNNEIGTVQPIAEIGKIIQKNNPKIIFHTDATQAVNYFDCNVEKLGVDLLSMSAHKIYGPKGVGVLYIKKGLIIAKIQDGGAQEFGLRAGTINTSGIVGLGSAISMIKDQRTTNNEKIKKLRDYLIAKVLKEIPDSRLNGSKIKRSPNNVNVNFSRVEGESLLMMLSSEGIFASTGSACSSGSLSPSHVLLSLGLKPEETHGSLRLTLGKNTTKKEVDYAVKVIKRSVEKLRKVSGSVLKDYYKNMKHKA
ncbi:MAG: cysteine desulfurase NifS [Candidatus Moranbacteria bacterium CG23_combo_of_CG06-09_8_20_14_all_35_22]|nr:MAG: cysteine desulfurase NifS [Candidatus Moranbacteria bacterium CG23_combo_of_CG06-09_8_20_14_all_35_22]